MRPAFVIAVVASLGLAVGVLVRLATRRRGVDYFPPSNAPAGSDRQTDEALIETFPASDPSAATTSLVSGSPGQSRRRR